jgi:steroid 5-alpha reductase family enzyme
VTSDDAKPSRGSWRVVWRALRVGHVDDPRYAALTWQTADRNVRNSWLLVFFAVGLTLQVILVVVRLARGDEWSNTVATAATAMCFAVGLGFLWVARRRSKRYLERNGAPPQPGSGQ